MVFHFPNKKLQINPCLHIGHNPILLQNQTPFLGVVDTHLRFQCHISSICKNISFGIRALLRARPHFSTKTLLDLYYEFIHSHLNYCIISWGRSYKNHLSPLEKLQKQAMRIITFSPKMSPSLPIFTELNILPLPKMHLYSVRVLFLKCCIAS